MPLRPQQKPVCAFGKNNRYCRLVGLGIVVSTVQVLPASVVFKMSPVLFDTFPPAAYPLFAPKNLMLEFRKVHQFMVFSANTPIQYALAEFLKQKNQYLELGNF